MFVLCCQLCPLRMVFWCVAAAGFICLTCQDIPPLIYVYRETGARMTRWCMDYAVAAPSPPDNTFRDSGSPALSSPASLWLGAFLTRLCILAPVGFLINRLTLALASCHVYFGTLRKNNQPKQQIHIHSLFPISRICPALTILLSGKQVGTSYTHNHCHRGKQNVFCVQFSQFISAPSSVKWKLQLVSTLSLSPLSLLIIKSVRYWGSILWCRAGRHRDEIFHN